MKRALIILLVIYAFFLPRAVAHEQWCLTPPGISPWLKAFQNNPEDHPDLRSYSGWDLPVVVHITEDQNLNQAVSISELLNAFCKLNQDFAASGIQFYIKSIEYLVRPDYYEHQQIQTAVSMIANHSQPNVINVFFVKTAVEEGICGYNLVNQDRKSLGMTLAGSCTNSFNSNWAHEMGHYFSLPHTFNGWEGIIHDYRTPAPELVNNVPVERADGSNCDSAGDGFCDTPADYLNGRWFCAEDGASSFLQMDPIGASFRSDGSMIMSYAQDGCSHKFSPKQISAMQNYLVSERVNLMGEPITFSAIRPNQIRLTYPAMAEQVGYTERLRFEWERIDGALGYILEVSLLPTFAVMEQQLFTFTANLSVDGLRPNRTYYWRIRPFNGKYTCPVYSVVQSFSIQSLTTNIQEPKNLAVLRVMPNPLPSGMQPAIEMVTITKDNWFVTLRNAAGQYLYQQSLTLMPGQHDLLLDINSKLTPGIYILQVKNRKGVATRKLVVQ